MSSDILWELVNTLAKNSSCKKRNVGAVVYNTKLDKVVGRGFNKHMNGICDCLTTKTAIHAEEAALKSIVGKYDRKDLVMFISHAPCANCKSLVETVVKEVRYRSQHD